MKTSSMIVGLVTIATMLALAVPAQAVIVLNETTGNIVFADNFENANVPTLAPQTGTWTDGGSATAAVSPGPFEGDQYLTGVRTPRPEAAQILDDFSLVALARSIDENQHLSRLYDALGDVLLRAGSRYEAFSVYSVATRLDPGNRSARRSVNQLRQQ